MEYNQSHHKIENNQCVGNKWRVLKNVIGMQQCNSKIFTKSRTKTLPRQQEETHKETYNV